MYHLLISVQKKVVFGVFTNSTFFLLQFQDFRFLCPNDTVFDQQNLVCTNWFEVDCHQSISFFFQGVGLKQAVAKQEKPKRPPTIEPEEYDYNYEYTYFYDDDFDQDQNRFLVNSTPNPASGNVGLGGSDQAQSFQGNNNLDQPSFQPLFPL